jgi:hypothetical protein
MVAQLSGRQRAGSEPPVSAHRKQSARKTIGPLTVEQLSRLQSAPSVAVANVGAAPEQRVVANERTTRMRKSSDPLIDIAGGTEQASKVCLIM